jgi:hypothetical protein
VTIGPIGFGKSNRLCPSPDGRRFAAAQMRDLIMTALKKFQNGWSSGENQERRMRSSAARLEDLITIDPVHILARM